MTAAMTKARPVEVFILGDDPDWDGLDKWAKLHGATVKDPSDRQASSAGIEAWIYPRSGNGIKITHRSYAVILYPWNGRMSVVHERSFHEGFDLK